MAEDSDPESKTEDASPKRREDAIKEGRVPFSTELVGAVVLLAAMIGLSSFGPAVGEMLLGVFKHDLRRANRSELTTADAQNVMSRVTVVALAGLGPFLLTLIAAGVAVSVLQVGFQVTPEKLELKFDRLDPIAGFGRVFSSQGAIKGGLAVLKVLAVSGVAYFVVGRRFGQIVGSSRDPLEETIGFAWGMVVRLGTNMAAFAVLIAGIDYFNQRRQFETSLRMTKQEVKDEYKQTEGDPTLKQRRRQLAQQMLKQKMLTEVPKATVVITNPTEYAVALRYAPGDAAPVLVAKGAGAFAERIRELARDNAVPVLERPPLARALFRGVKEGQAIPAGLYRAVAELIAVVYRLRGSPVS